MDTAKLTAALAVNAAHSMLVQRRETTNLVLDLLFAFCTTQRHGVPLSEKALTALSQASTALSRWQRGHETDERTTAMLDFCIQSCEDPDTAYLIQLVRDGMLLFAQDA